MGLLYVACLWGDCVRAEVGQSRNGGKKFVGRIDTGLGEIYLNNIVNLVNVRATVVPQVQERDGIWYIAFLLDRKTVRL